jgi:hypothetical protein
MPQRLFWQGTPSVLLLTRYLLVLKSTDPALRAAETFGGGAPMIFGATPPSSDVLAAIILFLLKLAGSRMLLLAHTITGTGIQK